MLQCVLFYPYPNISHPTLFSTVRGNIIVLNKRIQCMEQDEFIYQEMFAFLPLFGHPNPKQVRCTIFGFPFNIIFLIYPLVVIIGRGDSCVLREID
ncbi:unnamed protein product [Rotaria sp. Silwood2]|nr:unnamed protein product [Rotaria sp. Silwood2]CAF3216920.1 unnamed protein product [Rotaria sp. Silwood2]CAF4169537.1 unnamed protein product [Rotaria sp. Silwood2]CAF4359035.1 unnamed protein product [Rotaria sp. Silwood2]CAF4452261.1 unnamed protein product [Rotaria sp. Silwood2]